MVRKRVKPLDNWIHRSKFEIENEDTLIVIRTIALRIVRYMKDNNMNQNDIAEKLGVSPQYTSRLLHGKVTDLKISTVLRYSNNLGINLISIPED